MKHRAKVVNERIKVLNNQIDMMIDNLQSKKWSINYCKDFIIKEFHEVKGYVECSFELDAITYEEHNEYLRLIKQRYDAVIRHLQVKMLHNQQKEESMFYRMKRR